MRLDEGKVMHAKRISVFSLGGAILVAAVLAPLTGSAQIVPSSFANQAEELRVLTTEDAYVAAEIGRDEAALRRLVDDRFQYNSSHGTTTGKAELIASVLKMNMADQTIRERSVLLEGNLALVFGTAEMVFANPGKPASTSVLRYTATYINRQGDWRLLALQMQARAPE
jgi:hypothetical protein